MRIANNIGELQPILRKFGSMQYCFSTLHRTEITILSGASRGIMFRGFAETVKDQIYAEVKNDHR
jgi:hypothetical protein